MTVTSQSLDAAAADVKWCQVSSLASVKLCSSPRCTSVLKLIASIWIKILNCDTKLQALVYDILPLEEGAGKRCSECHNTSVSVLTRRGQAPGSLVTCPGCFICPPEWCLNSVIPLPFSSVGDQLSFCIVLVHIHNWGRKSMNNQNEITQDGEWAFTQSAKSWLWRRRIKIPAWGLSLSLDSSMSRTSLSSGLSLGRLSSHYQHHFDYSATLDFF